MNALGFRILSNVLERSLGVSPAQLAALVDRVARYMPEETRVAYADDRAASSSDRKGGRRRKGLRVAVIGAGVAGLTAAHELQARGFDVTVYEASRELGGKSRSVGVPGSAAEGLAPLPGEHGFRFFPAFYRHLRDTLSRIPCAPGAERSVLSRLVRTRHVTYQPVGQPERVERTDRARGADLARYLADEDYAWASLRLLTACNRRRREVYEHVSMQALCPGGELVKIPKLLVACSAREISARTALTVLAQLSQGRMAETCDALLDGPTSERWFDPWRAELERLGVRFELGIRAQSIACRDGEVVCVHTRGADGCARRIVADHYVLAVPVEAAVRLIGDSPGLRAADPGLSSLGELRTDWMAGLQLYYDRPLGWRPGHYVFPDSPWALTAIEQNLSWRGHALDRCGDGRVRGLVSAIISDWWTPGMLYGKPASQCTEAELIAETRFQMASAFAAGSEQRSRLAPEHLLHGFVGPGIEVERAPSASGTPRVHNHTPLFVNTVGSFEKRPHAGTGVANLYLAGDYVCTNTDLACMESANEAARRAVNALLDRAESPQPRCAIYPLREPAGLAFFKALDRLLYEQGAPGLFDHASTATRRKLHALLRAIPGFVDQAAAACDGKHEQSQYRQIAGLMHMATRVDVELLAELFEALLPAVPRSPAGSVQELAVARGRSGRTLVLDGRQRLTCSYSERQ